MRPRQTGYCSSTLQPFLIYSRTFQIVRRTPRVQTSLLLPIIPCRKVAALQNYRRPHDNVTERPFHRPALSSQTTRRNLQQSRLWLHRARPSTLSILWTVEVCVESRVFKRTRTRSTSPMSPHTITSDRLIRLQISSCCAASGSGTAFGSGILRRAISGDSVYGFMSRRAIRGC